MEEREKLRRCRVEEGMKSIYTALASGGSSRYLARGAAPLEMHHIQSVGNTKSIG
jgi:hypothetical protein